MQYYPHMPDVLRLAKHSLRLRELLAVHDRSNPGFYSRDYIGELTGLVVDLKLSLNETCWRDPTWSRGALPSTVNEAGGYLAWPEVIGTEAHMAAVNGCQVGLRYCANPSSAIKWLTSIILKRAWRRGVPLYPVRMHRPAAVGLDDVRPGGCVAADQGDGVAAVHDPFAHGRAVELAHMGEVVWCASAVSWLHELAEEAAADTGALIAMGPSAPAVICVADEDGVICPGTLPGRPESRLEERERMLRHYMGGPGEPHPGALPVWLPGSGIEPADWLARRPADQWEPLERSALQIASDEQRKLVEAFEKQEARRVAERTMFPGGYRSVRAGDAF